MSGEGKAYYNEFDPNAAQWLRNLIEAGLIAPGDVDERSIEDVQPDDLKPYTQCHFFAGISGWSLALRMAGWPDARPVWSGSCPRQPFSSAGKRKAHEDERHLWPAFYRLIRECRPPAVFGEQVASSEIVGTQLEAAFVVAVQAGEFARANKLAKRLAASSSFHFHQRWLDGVQADLAAADYAFWPEVVGAHSVGAPHIRQRLYWVADAKHSQSRCGVEGVEGSAGSGRYRPAIDGATCGLSDAERAAGRARSVDRSHAGREASERDESADRLGECGPADGLEHDSRNGRQQRRAESGGRGIASGCGDGGGVGVGVGVGEGLEGHAGHGVNGDKPGRVGAVAAGPATASGGIGHWSDFAIVACRDGKFRRVPRAESEVQRVVDGLPGSVGFPCADRYPLAEKSPGRVGKLKGYGNAIVPQDAAAFIRAYRECCGIE